MHNNNFVLCWQYANLIYKTVIVVIFFKGWGAQLNTLNFQFISLLLERYQSFEILRESFCAIIQICSPWAARSCCTEDTALDIHTNPTWLNFDWNHCAPLSAQCREHFIMDSCFYSCSPNVGPWLVKVNGS